jgi:hypothetical protein
LKINNINEKRREICACGSWLNHWKKFSPKPFKRYCPVIGCTEKPEVGALIRKVSSTDERWYITLLCEKHEAQTGKSLDVTDSTILVSANIADTCGKDNSHSFKESFPRHKNKRSQQMIA